MKRFVIATALLTLGGRGICLAQDSVHVEMSPWVQPGSDEENYLRYLQTLGLVRKYPWSVRAFSPDELLRLEPASPEHPWSSASAMRGKTRAHGPLRIALAPAAMRASYNTGFPFGANDGAVWQGRGLTIAASAGAFARLGPAELTLAPLAFWSENRGFPLLPSKNVREPFGNPTYIDVDLPQRFGNRSYGQLDLGESALRLGVGGLALGLSNAHESWGPMTEFPLILGTNAAAFPHAFFGFSRPVNIYVGSVNGRVIYGSLDQSAYSPVQDGNGRRFAAGVIAVFQPRGLPGLEVGATRFMHVRWPTEGLTTGYFTHLFESFLKQRVGKVFAPDSLDPNSSTDNQLASVFARWVIAPSGFEVYGEYGREDHNADTRDLILEPDHAAAFGLGIRKAWQRSASLFALRIEAVDFRTPALARHRPEEAWYRHVYTQQGHTNRGQLLAAPVGVGSGAGSSVILERFDQSGSRRARWSRFLVRDQAGNAAGANVQQALQLEQRRWMTRTVEARAALDGVWEFNRTTTSDRTNLRLQIATTWYPESR